MCWFRSTGGVRARRRRAARIGGLRIRATDRRSPARRAGAADRAGDQPDADAEGPDQAGPGRVHDPDQRVDTKQLTEVVKEEVKGGEAQEGPTPFDYLWLPSKPELIKDEPLTVTVPPGFTPLATKVNVPVSNPLTKGKYELGRQLYFDPRVSLDGTVSCATCHNPAKGWTDGMPVSIGIDGQTGSRSAPTVLNTVYGQDDVLGWPGPVAGGPGAGAGPEPDRDGEAVVQGDHRAAAEDPRLPRAVREGLRHRRDARRHGQGDRHVRARRGDLGQLEV